MEQWSKEDWSVLDSMWILLGSNPSILGGDTQTQSKARMCFLFGYGDLLLKINSLVQVKGAFRRGF